MAKNSKALERAKKAAESARRGKAKAKAKVERKVFVAGAAYGLGLAQKNGMLASLPGPNKHLSVAILGLGVASFTSGKASDVADAFSDAALAIYVNGLATGATVSGGSPSTAQLTRELERALSSVEGDYDDDIGDDDDDIGDDDEYQVGDDDVIEGELVGDDGDGLD